MGLQPSSNGAIALRPRVTCPHCWSLFSPEDVLWIAAHSDLQGDPRLGEAEHQRFLPSRFDAEGNALDARGFVCRELACPRCHLRLPRPFVELEPAFVSILGSTSCGKSFLLSAMTWELRRLLPQQFAIAFEDADPASNQILIEYEKAVFLHPKSQGLVIVSQLIRHTEEPADASRLYAKVSFGGQEILYPRPFIFAIRPHQARCPDGPRGRLLCLYDNSGESFKIGHDSTSAPVTHHMAQAQFLLFLFDPIQDQRFLRYYRNQTGVEIPPYLIPKHTEQGQTVLALERQETILQEAATRIRRLLNLPDHQKHDRPLIVIVTKADVWSRLLPNDLGQEPWGPLGCIHALDVDAIEQRSRELRDLLLRACPSLVHSAEGFARQVSYVPVSALGVLPMLGRDKDGKEWPAVRPADIRPRWATIPLLYGLVRTTPGLIPVQKAHVLPPRTGIIVPR